MNFVVNDLKSMDLESRHFKSIDLKSKSKFKFKYPNTTDF